MYWLKIQRKLLASDTEEATGLSYRGSYWLKLIASSVA
jgi:hypothetical protein